MIGKKLAFFFSTGPQKKNLAFSPQLNVFPQTWGPKKAKNSSKSLNIFKAQNQVRPRFSKVHVSLKNSSYTSVVKLSVDVDLSFGDITGKIWDWKGNIVVRR